MILDRPRSLSQEMHQKMRKSYIMTTAMDPRQRNNIPPSQTEQPSAATPAQPQPTPPGQTIAPGFASDGSGAYVNENSPAQVKKHRRFSSFMGLFSIIQLFGGALLLALAINHYVFQSYQVFGQSMTPTLHEGDRLIISKFGKTWNHVFSKDYSPHRGDIIVFINPRNSRVQLIKRVIGVAGERVVVEDGNITVYNDEHPEGFDPDPAFDVSFQPTDGNVDVEISEGEIFVTGDNRIPGGSLDSRNELGKVPIENVVGRLVLRIFPLGGAQFF